MRFLLLAVVFLSGPAFAANIVEGTEAQKMYEQLITLQTDQPEAVVSYVNAFWGDDRHPNYGKLFLTTIFAKVEPKHYCFQYDYRDVKIIEYRCEVR